MSLRRRDLLRGSFLAVLSSAVRLRALNFAPNLFSKAQGRPLKGVRVGSPVPLADSNGDTWVAAWADDDNLYSPSNDTTGFNKAANSNVAFNRISGSDPFHLSGVTVNSMADYGKEVELGPDGCSWKSSGCAFIDGVLYWVVARHHYGEDSGDPYRRQPAQNASIIKSTDYGRTWMRSVEANYHTPMFPGSRFATPYFIDFGHGNLKQSHLADHVYAVSNNGFWDCGDDMVLGRVARSKIGLLNGSDWEFYTGGNGELTTSWSGNMNAARPILKASRRFGMTGAVYLPAHQRYFMIGWFYPAGGGKMKAAATHTTWEFYESPQPWGPWTRIGSYESVPSGYYCPQVCPKFQTSDKVFALTAGNWDSPPDYRLTVVPLEITT